MYSPTKLIKKVQDETTNEMLTTTIKLKDKIGNDILIPAYNFCDLYYTSKEIPPAALLALPFSGYELALMPDITSNPRKIGLKIRSEGLQYEVMGLDGERQTNTIPWNKLPGYFPRNTSDIIKGKDRFLSIILEHTIKAGHTPFPSNLAYMRTGQKLYYVDRDRAYCVLLPLKKENIARFDMDLSINIQRDGFYKRLSYQELNLIKETIKHHPPVSAAVFIRKQLLRISQYYEQKLHLFLLFGTQIQALNFIKNISEDLEHRFSQLLFIRLNIWYAQETINPLIFEISSLYRGNGCIAETLRYLMTEPNFAAAYEIARTSYIAPVAQFSFRHPYFIQEGKLSEMKMQFIENYHDGDPFYNSLKQSVERIGPLHAIDRLSKPIPVDTFFEKGKDFFNLSETAYGQLLAAAYSQNSSRDYLSALNQLLANPPQACDLGESFSKSEVEKIPNFKTLLKRYQHQLKILIEKNQYDLSLQPYAPLWALQALHQNNSYLTITPNTMTDKILDHMLSYWLLTAKMINRQWIRLGSRIEVRLDHAFASLKKPACQVQELYLAHQLFAEEINPLWQALEQNKSVTLLDLSGITFTNQSICGLTRVLERNTTLKIIKLVNCHLTDKQFICLVDALKTNQTLTEIDCSKNQDITWEGIKQLITILKNRTPPSPSPRVQLDGNVYINAYWRKKLNRINSSDDQLVKRLQGQQQLISIVEPNEVREAWLSQQQADIESAQMAMQEARLAKSIHEHRLRETIKKASTEREIEKSLRYQRIKNALISHIEETEARLQVLEIEIAGKKEKREFVQALAQQSGPLAEFYCLLMTQLENVLFGCKAIASGLIDCTELNKFTYTNIGLDIGLNVACGLIGMIPVIGGMTSAICRAVGQSSLAVSKYLDQTQRNEAIMRIARSVNLEAVETVPHQVAKALTHLYHDQLMQLRTREEELAARQAETTIKGKAKAMASIGIEKARAVFMHKNPYSDAEKVALLMVVRILTSLQEGKIERDGPLAEQLLAEIPKELTHTESFLHKLYELLGAEVIVTKTGEECLLKDILKTNYIKVKNAAGGYDYYANSPIANGDKETFRIGSIEEVHRLNLQKIKSTQAKGKEKEKGENLPDPEKSRVLTSYQKIQQHRKNLSKQWATEFDFKSEIKNILKQLITYDDEEIKSLIVILIEPLKLALAQPPDPSRANSTNVQLYRVDKLEEVVIPLAEELRKINEKIKTIEGENTELKEKMPILEQTIKNLTTQIKNVNGLMQDQKKDYESMLSIRDQLINKQQQKLDRIERTLGLPPLVTSTPTMSSASQSTSVSNNSSTLFNSNRISNIPINRNAQSAGEDNMQEEQSENTRRIL